MILFEFGDHRQELASYRVARRVRPIDECGDIGIDPDRHAHFGESRLDLCKNVRCHQAVQRSFELMAMNECIFVLPSRIFKYFRGEVSPDFESLPLVRH